MSVEATRDIEWATYTCTLGFHVFGKGPSMSLPLNSECALANETTPPSVLKDFFLVVYGHEHFDFTYVQYLWKPKRASDSPLVPIVVSCHGGAGTQTPGPTTFGLVHLLCPCLGP